MFVAATFVALGMISSVVSAQGQPAGARTGTPQPQPQPVSRTVAVVKMERLVFQNLYFERAMKPLQQKFDQAQLDMKKRYDDLVQESKSLEMLDRKSEQFVQQSTLLDKKRTALEADARGKQTEVLAEEQRLALDVYNRVRLYIDAYAKQRQISIVLFVPTIFDESAVPANVHVVKQVAWYNPSLDITEDIMLMLDSQFEKEYPNEVQTLKAERSRKMAELTGQKPQTGATGIPR